MHTYVVLASAVEICEALIGGHQTTGRVRGTRPPHTDALSHRNRLTLRMYTPVQAPRGPNGAPGVSLLQRIDTCCRRMALPRQLRGRAEFEFLL